MRGRWIGTWTAAGCLLAALPAAAQVVHGTPLQSTQSTLKVTAQAHVDGAGAYRGVPRLDAATGRVYAARGATVDVIDAKTLARVGSVAGFKDARALAIVPALHTGFVADAAGDAVVQFDLASLATVKRFASGAKGPTAIEYDRATGRLFVAHEAAGTVAVIDAQSGKVLAQVPAGGTPRQLVSNHYGRVYVTVPERDHVLLIDSRAMKPIGSFDLFGARQPDGIDIDAVNRRLYVSTADGRLVILDSDIGFKLIALPTVPGPSTCAVEVRPVPGQELEKAPVVHAYVASADGTLTVAKMLRFDTFAVVRTVRTAPGRAGVAARLPDQGALVALDGAGDAPNLLGIAP